MWFTILNKGRWCSNQPTVNVSHFKIMSFTCMSLNLTQCSVSLELVRAALRKYSWSHEQGWAVNPRLLSPQRTGSQFDGMLESEEKFKACLSIESQQAKEKWPKDKKTDRARHFRKSGERERKLYINREGGYKKHLTIAGSDRKGVQEVEEDVINLGKWALSLSPLSTVQPYAVVPYFILWHFLLYM